MSPGHATCEAGNVAKRTFLAGKCLVHIYPVRRLLGFPCILF